MVLKGYARMYSRNCGQDQSWDIQGPVQKLEWGDIKTPLVISAMHGYPPVHPQADPGWGSAPFHSSCICHMYMGSAPIGGFSFEILCIKKYVHS